MSSSRPSLSDWIDTGARPFICPEPSCLRGFSVQSNLKRHAKTHQLGVAGHGGGASLQQLAVPGPKGRAVHPPPSRQPQKHLSLGEVKVEDIEEGEDELDDDEEDDEL